MLFQQELSHVYVYLYLILACSLGFIYGIYNWIHVLSLNTDSKFDEDEPLRKNLHPDQIKKMNETSAKINSVKYISNNLGCQCFLMERIFLYRCIFSFFFTYFNLDRPI